MIKKISSIGVFCGSRIGRDPYFIKVAQELGTKIAQADLRLVYGGGDVGLMGAVSSAVLKAGGQVTGVIPEFLKAREVMHTDKHDLTLTETMHQRKELLYAYSDAFIILPGGLGTYDESFEAITWRQLGLHNKPIIFMNVNGYAKAVLNLIETIIENDFASSSIRTLYEVVDNVDSALKMLLSMERDN